MTQYLLAIYNADDLPDLSLDELRQSFADVAVVNAKMTDAGAFVFGGGLLPAESAIVVRQSGSCRLPIEVRRFDERDSDALLAAYGAQ